MTDRTIETTAQLFDLCHELFGVGGDYDPLANPSPPWFKVRMNEIGKLNRILKARKIDVRSMVIAAEYCHREGIPIKATGELIAHITDALIDLRARQQTAKTQNLYDRINRAAEVALEQGNTELAEQITRIPFAAAADALPEVEKTLGIEEMA